VSGKIGHEASINFLPKQFLSPLSPHTPILTATGRNWWVVSSSEYLATLIASAADAATPTKKGSSKVRWCKSVCGGEILADQADQGMSVLEQLTKEWVWVCRVSFHPNQSCGLNDSGNANTTESASYYLVDGELAGLSARASPARQAMMTVMKQGPRKAVGRVPNHEPDDGDHLARGWVTSQHPGAVRCHCTI